MNLPESNRVEYKSIIRKYISMDSDNRQSNYDQYLDLKALSRYSCMGVSTLREHIAESDTFPYYRVKGKILVKKSEFDTWIERFREGPNDRIQTIVDKALKDISKGESE